MIEIQVSRADDKVRLLARDSGKGMAAEVARRAFEPFFTTKAKGTGLGLPICKKIVEAHGGQIRISSQPNVGTEVCIELPAQTSGSGPPGTPRPDQPSSVAVSVGPSGDRAADCPSGQVSAGAADEPPEERRSSRSDTRP